LSGQKKHRSPDWGSPESNPLADVNAYAELCRQHPVGGDTVAGADETIRQWFPQYYEQYFPPDR
jgi:hypothetical protein